VENLLVLVQKRHSTLEVEEKIWLVSFLDFDLGYFDEKEGRVEPGPNPFEAKVLTMPPN
jgi:hypothetical protein